MTKSLYLINPADDFPTYFGSEVVGAWGCQPATTISDLATTTVAALVPDDFRVRICDERLGPIDFDCGADFVALSAKTSQHGRLEAVAREFRARGRTVILGGAFASLSPTAARPHCDVLVTGEIEEIAPQLFGDLRSGSWRDEYQGTRPSLEHCPVPRWDLYPNDRTLLGAVQTSRGCPFECDFCDAIVYLGRRQRHKPVGRVLDELERLYGLGYREVFLADDNFSAARSRAKELLVALKTWNERRDDGKVLFSTQLSLDAAGDEELLRLCAEAGLVHVFVGIETPNTDSLRAAKKRQNLGGDPLALVRRFHEHGMLVVSGMVVGFDQDGADVFERQHELAAAAALPVVTLGALVAPEGTPLRARLQAEGRLLDDGVSVAATPWSTNVVPRQMSRGELLNGIAWLANKLYAPQAFARRVSTLLERLGPRRDPRHRAGEWSAWRTRRSVEKDARRLMGRLALRGPQEAAMVARIALAVARRPWTLDFVGPLLLHYAQLRHLYERGGLWKSGARLS